MLNSCIPYFRPEVIATGVIQLIEKDSTNAAVMMVTKNRGIEIMRPRGSRISKLWIVNYYGDDLILNETKKEQKKKLA